jgi:hypothetical protein
MSSAKELVATSKTWSVLRSTQNPAATIVLGAGLTHPKATVRHNCLKALIARNSEAANMLILTHWNVYDSKDRQLLCQHSLQFTAAVRVLLSRGTVQIRELMLSAVSDLDLIDCTDVLIELAINKKHSLSPKATSCLLSLCKSWGNANRFGESRGEAHRPALVKMLHGELMRFPKSETLMEAWLSVAHWEDGPQRSLIADTSQPVYSQLLKALSETTDPTALQLLAGYFWRSTTPPSITSIICEQPCPTLAIEMAKLVTNDRLETVLLRLRSFKPLACMTNLDIDELSLDRAVYRRLLLMMVASREDVGWSLSRCTSLAKGSSAEMRRLATEVLQNTRVASMEKLIAIMQEDSTNNGGQKAIRDIHEIMGWLKHPSVALRQAATVFFKEFTVESLVRQVGVWPARMCRVMANVVAKVDTKMLQTLDEYLTSPAPKKRIAALQAVELLGCAPQLRERVLGLLNDPRIDVRVQVVDTLSASNDESLLPLIPQLLLDANTDVVDAANRASKRIERLGSSKTK